jgi:DNA end-binding protein Ku
MRPIRSFVLRLGDLTIPVGLVATVSDNDERLFTTLHAECKTPVTMRVFCNTDGRVLDETETVKAWQAAPGQYVELDQAEVDALTPIDSSVVPLAGFVDETAIDPLLVRKRYHLAPGKNGVGKAAYLALATEMWREHVSAVTRFTAWKSEQLAAISSRGRELELATLHPLDDLVQADAIAAALDGIEISDVVVTLMCDVVRRYTRRLKPDDLALEQRPRIRALLETKLAGGTIVAPPREKAEIPTTQADLESALRSTLRSAPRPRRQNRAPVKST